MTVKIGSCSTSVMIPTVEQVVQTAQTVLSLIYRNVGKPAASTELVSKSSRLLIVVMVYEATDASSLIKSLWSILVRSSRKTNVTAA